MVWKIVQRSNYETAYHILGTFNSVWDWNIHNGSRIGRGGEEVGQGEKRVAGDKTGKSWGQMVKDLGSLPTFDL